MNLNILVDLDTEEQEATFDVSITMDMDELMSVLSIRAKQLGITGDEMAEHLNDAKDAEDARTRLRIALQHVLLSEVLTSKF